MLVLVLVLVLVTVTDDDARLIVVAPEQRGPDLAVHAALPMV